MLVKEYAHASYCWRTCLHAWCSEAWLHITCFIDQNMLLIKPYSSQVLYLQTWWKVSYVTRFPRRRCLNVHIISSAWRVIPIRSSSHCWRASIGPDPVKIISSYFKKAAQSIVERAVDAQVWGKNVKLQNIQFVVPKPLLKYIKNKEK